MRAHNVILGKSERVFEGVLHMATGRKVHDTVNLVSFQGKRDCLGIGDGAVDESETWELEQLEDIVDGGDIFHLVEADDVVAVVVLMD